MNESRSTILIISSQNSDIDLAQSVLERGGLRVLGIHPDANGLSMLLGSSLVHGVVLEWTRPRDLGLVRAIKTQGLPLPVALIAPESRELRLAAYAAGADEVLTRPIDEAILEARMSALARQHRATVHLEDAAGVLGAVARAVEMHDPYTAGHLERLRRLGGRVALHLGLDRMYVEAIRTAGVLHDIGKVAIPGEVLRKRGPLTDTDWTLMREHPSHGERIVANLRQGRLIAPIVRGHHERWDGLGYPDGLRAKEIPLGARIIATVDAFDAMTTDRPYRRAMTRAEARRRLELGAGTQFDPDIVQTVLELSSVPTA
jgi:putative two-component system response regulator